MSFGYSVGDVIAIGSLLTKIISSLRASTGSSVQYQELIAELYCLQRAILEVEHLCRLLHSPFPDATMNSILYAVKVCRKPLGEFLQRIEKYRKRLRDGGSGNMMKDSWRKVGWALFKESEVRELREIAGMYTSSITLLMTTAGM